MKWMSKDSWWIEYVEGELPEEAQEEAEWLLKHSPLDRLVVENLHSIKDLVWQASQIELPKEESYWQGLQAKILEKVEGETQESAGAKSSKADPGKRRRAGW